MVRRLCSDVSAHPYSVQAADLVPNSPHPFNPSPVVQLVRYASHQIGDNDSTHTQGRRVAPRQQNGYPEQERRRCLSCTADLQNGQRYPSSGQSKYPRPTPACQL